MPKEKVVVAKRGCTCCGTGCVVSLLGIPLTILATWEMVGIVEAVALWPTLILGAHGIRWATNTPRYVRYPTLGAITSNRVIRVAAAAAIAIVVVIIAAGCGGATASPSSSTAAAPAAETGQLPCSAFDPSAQPQRCMTPAQRKAARRAVARRVEAAQARAVRARAAAKRAAASRAAAFAAANAWHQGYLGPSGDNLDIYGRWRTDLACASYATYGCLHFEAITANGCRYISITVNEMRDGAIVGSLLQNAVNVPPKTPVILELDADATGITGGPPTITCTNY